MFIILLISGCGGGGGGGGGNTTPPPATDTTAPSIAFTYPASGATFVVSSAPQYVSLQYSDASGVSASTLEVTYSMKTRTVTLTDLFGRDATTNATTSRTTESDTNPLTRSVITRFAATDTNFATVLNTVTVDREGQGALDMACDTTTGRVVAWNPADTKIYLITTGASMSVSPVSLGFAPVSVAAGGGRVYAARSDAAQVAVYNASTGAAVTTITLPSIPKLLAFHPETSKLYISYTASTDISRYDPAIGAIDLTIATGLTPALLETRRGDATAGVFAVGPAAGAFHLREYNAAGAQARDITLGLNQPSDMKFVSSGYVYLSNYAANTVTRAQLSDNTTLDIAAGSLPKKIIVYGTDRVYAINSGGKSLTRIVSAAPSAAVTFPTLPVSGSGACETGYVLVAEDLWSLDTQETIVLQTKVKDTRGNQGTASLTIYAQPDAPGGV